VSNFRVGQKVVCVNDSMSAYGVTSPLKKGSVYTVSDVMFGTSWRGPDTGLILVGVPCVAQFVRGYSASRFRPVVERKTDISIFKAMLNPKQASADQAPAERQTQS
jgi:hypothetical protein